MDIGDFDTFFELDFVIVEGLRSWNEAVEI